MAGILRLSNTGTGNGQSTITTAATGDATYTLPSFGGTLLTSSGNVTLPFASGTVSAPSVTFISDLDTGLYSPGANQVAIATSGTERVRIDTSGKVLVGTSTPRTTANGVTSTIQIEGTTGDGSSFSLTRNNGLPYFTFGRTGGGSVGSNAIVSDGNELGRIAWAAADGTDLNCWAAQISALVDGTPGVDDMPGRLVFSTTPDGSSNPTERLRISQNGVVTIKNGAVAEIGTLADGATITPDLAANCNFTITISGNRTLANPSNITAGQTGSIFIIQGTGSNTLSWGSYWDFPGGSAPTLTTTSGAVDRVDYVVRSSTSIHTVFTANYS